MGATSVTGVSGYGSVQDGRSKGSPHMTLGVSHLIGPRVLAAGSVTLTGGATTGTVDHETLANTTGNIVVLTSSSATAPFVSSRTTSSFAFTSGANTTVSWVIISTGMAANYQA